MTPGALPRRGPPRLALAVLALAVAAGLVVAPRLAPLAVAQQGFVPGGAVDNERLAGLQWTFARIRYSSFADGGRRGFWEDPWAIDGPAAEQNMSRRLKTVSAIEVGEPVVIELEDEKLWQYPWIYMVEPSNLRLTDTEIPILREFLLRGGTLTFDDFHGPYEWDITVRQIKQVFPEREIVELTPPHPIYTSFYQLDKYPQIPGLGSFFNGRTWEKGGFVPHLRAILDDDGRPMVLFNWNTDMGDGWEWSNAEEYPGYLKWTALSYQMMINEIVYTLTH